MDDAHKGVPPCPIPKAFARAAVGIGKTQEPYHGYYFAVLKAQGPDATGGEVNYVVNNEMIGGFGLIAWPAEYGVSGVQTFIVNHDGTVYEKTLGPDTWLPKSRKSPPLIPTNPGVPFNNNYFPNLPHHEDRKGPRKDRWTRVRMVRRRRRLGAEVGIRQE